MDEQTQSFLELTAKDDLVQLVADTRAAWLWSADGARILWANTAGAAFFSAGTVQDLSQLTALERSPARPHIARIAESGPTEKFSIDRLRFYRGLRVMLLTCQCKRLVLETGEAAALIVCGDKGLATTKDPVSTFARMLGTDSTTVFVTSGRDVNERLGDLAGTPEDLELPAGQHALFGPVGLDGAYHEGVVVQVSEQQKLVVLDNSTLPEDAGEDDGPDGAADDDAAWVRADDDALETDADDGGAPEIADPAALAGGEDMPSAGETLADVPPEPVAEETTSGLDMSTETAGESTEETAAPEDRVTPEATDAHEPDDLDAGHRDISEQDDGESTAADDGFVFQPRRRPVRFAWKMDIDQRFTFLSDEFAEVLGPVATDIIGLTWEEVSDRFDLDPRGHIGRALDRRDTWSGKTVNWPVSGASLRVPVDLAALPAFDRNRKFEGYRGFGVCRTADALTEAASSAPGIAPASVLAATGDGPAAPAEGTDGDPEDGAATELGEPDTNDTHAAAEAHSGTEGTREVQSDEAPSEGPAADDEGAGPDETGPSDAPESSLEDLKPAQPDSFAGKTFLGASAAALVGSLARFTGKPAPQTQESPKPSETAAAGTAPESDDAKAGNKTSAMSDDAGTVIDEDADDLPGAALDSRLEALQTGRPFDPVETEVPAEDDDTPDIEDTPETEETAAAPDDAGEPEADHVADDAATAAIRSGTADAGGFGANDSHEDAIEDTGDTSPEVPETLAEKPGDEIEPEHEDEPAGISGPAALKPAEIESAVKSLAKSYKAAERKPRDLFEDVSDQQAPVDVELPDAAEESSVPEDGTDETEPALEDAHFDIVDEDSRAIEATAADLDETAQEPDEQDGGATADADSADETDTDEREFFEETGAFETEDQAAEVAESTEPPRTGEVIPLATARPRVVPVDTSSLSRPERQAFRKIAEALGARLEGDLADWDAPDAVAEPEDDLLPEVPEAGPIDPSLLDRLPIGIGIVNDREVLYANKALLAMLGYNSIAKLSLAGGLEALFIDDTEDLPDAEGMDGEVDEAMKLRLADGGVLNVDAHMHSVPWNGSQGLMISITERKTKPAAAAPSAPASPNFFAEVRAELDSARNQIAEMDTILETATDGVLVLDQHGTILKVNGSAEALFSANRSDMIGAPFTDFLAPESHRAAADYLDGLSRNGVASILNDGREVLGTVPAGGLIPLFMTMGRISGGQDDAKYCAVLRDITQWKTAEEELTQAKRQAENASSAKSDFLAKISHEIRTPLNAIIGFSEVMMEERFGPIGNDRYKDYLKDIRTSGSHIMSLINDLLDLSKIEAGKLDLKFSAVSTNDVINECVALMQPQANRERVIIRASLPDSVPDVVADPRSLRQIVLNLLSNAIKYNRSGGQVILSTALESNGEVALRVRDTGTGMTAKQLTAALEPFRQLHTSSRGGGTGLGLPLTKALVEANRASFHIDSTPDQGTLVEIMFPTQRVLSE